MCQFEYQGISHSQANHRWCDLNSMMLMQFDSDALSDKIFELLCLKSLLSSFDCIDVKWA